MKFEDIFVKQTVNSKGILTSDYVSIDSTYDIQRRGDIPSRYISPSDFVFQTNEDAMEDAHNSICTVWALPSTSSYCAPVSSRGDERASKSDKKYGIRPQIVINTDIALMEDGPLGKFKVYNGIHCISFENLVWPQSLCSPDLSAELDKAKKENKVFFNTSRSYILSAPNTFLSEIVYNNNRYINVANKWFKVEPIRWEIKNWSSMPREIAPDKTVWWEDSQAADKIILKSTLGILALPFHTSDCKYCELWQNSLIRAYLNGINNQAEINSGNGDPSKTTFQNFSFSDNSFLNQAFLLDKAALHKISLYPKNNRGENGEKEKKVKKTENPYGVTVDETPLTAKEQMKFYIDTGKAFMLHGPSGVGKTRRVKELDPDCVCLQLRNGILPEEIIGKTAYEDGNSFWIEPTWYTRLCEICKKDPEHNHVLFIDEITNVRPNEQSLVFHIVLEHSIDGNIGKLPDNCVVVAAGNSPKESDAAYNMPEPLFRRFEAHVELGLDIKSFLEWGSEFRDDGNTKIHPLIAAYIAKRGNSVFYSDYDADKPPKFAIDPRGWEQISSIIYNNNNTLQFKLIADKTGAKIANDLISFARNFNNITLDNILQDNVSYGIFPKDDNSRHFLICQFRHVDRDNLSKVRDYIEYYLGSEKLQDFDELWVNGDKERENFLEKIKEEKKKEEEESNKATKEPQKEPTQQPAKENEKENDFDDLFSDTQAEIELHKYENRILSRFNYSGVPTKYLKQFVERARKNGFTYEQLQNIELSFEFIDEFELADTTIKNIIDLALSGIKPEDLEAEFEIYRENHSPKKRDKDTDLNDFYDM